MPAVQVILDADGARAEALRDCARALLAAGPHVVVVNADPEVRRALESEFGEQISTDFPTALAEQVVVTSAEVIFATGSIERLRARAAVPGRIITRVYIPGLAGLQRTALWSGSWLTSQGIGASELLGLDLSCDRAQLSHQSPTVRAWVAADEIGIVAFERLETDAQRWSYSTGRSLSRSALASAVRSPLGLIKRRARLWQQRRSLTKAQSVR